MELTVKTDDFRHQVYNALLYADKKSEPSGNTLWVLQQNRLRMITSDDFVVLTHEIPVISQEVKDADAVVSLDQVKVWKRQLDELTKEPETVDVVIDHSTSAYDGFLRSLLDDILFAQPTRPAEIPFTWGLWPDRLRKLTLVQPRGNPFTAFWVDLKGVESPVLKFRLGLNIQGMLAPIDLEKLEM